MSSIDKGNIYFGIKDEPAKYEIFKELCSSENILIERIISSGQTTPEGKWLEQDKDEWVILLKGEAVLTFKTGEIFDLSEGDYIFIPANTLHRVDKTSIDPKCIWLAVHGNLRTTI
jgi:cupin 2 domain-containing protein